MKGHLTTCSKCKTQVANKSSIDTDFICNNCLIKEISDDKLTEERDYVENLFVGRFNYYLVIFSLIITAGFANSLNNKYIVFYFGALLLFMCWLPLARAYKKLNCILTIIFGYKKDHITYRIESIMKNNGYKHKFIISRWMGLYIPVTCIAFLIVMGLLINFDYIN